MAAGDETFDAMVVGCGGIGSAYDEGVTEGPPLTHAGAYAAHVRTRLAAGVEPDRERRSRFETHRDVPCYATLATAIREQRPAIASVCTPPETHLQIVHELVEAGVAAVWCEKPLAADPAEARVLVKSCEDGGAALQVNFLRRFDTLHRSVAAELVGIPMHADFRYSGSLSNYGTHAFDLFRWLAGEVTWIQAVAVDGAEPAVLARAGEKSTATFLQVRNPAGDVLDTVIYAGESRIMLSCLGEELVRAVPRASQLFPGYVSLPAGALEASGGLAEAMLNGVAALVEHLDASVPMLCDGRDGVAALEIEAAVAKSLDTGKAATPLTP
jgi:predicted dehydrogenase